jgi:hypothetical protein
MVVVGPTRDVVVVVDLAWCSDGGGGSGTVLCWWLRHMVRVTPMCSMVVAPTCGGGGAPVVVDPVAPPLPLVRFELPPVAA